jgi:choline-sulfatase
MGGRLHVSASERRRGVHPFVWRILVLGLVMSCSVRSTAPGSTASASDPATRTEGPWSVLLITVDNLRPDHMSVYGYDKDTTPHLKRFAQEAAVFESAFSTSAWTAPGMVSIFTGYYPPVHAQSGRFSFYDSEMTSALRVLAEAGYEVLGQWTHGPSHEDFGFGGDLGELEDFVETRVGNDKPYFAWTHLRDVHLPYAPAEEGARRFGRGSRTSEGIEAVRTHKVILRYPEELQLDMDHAGKVSFDEADVPEIRALYDGEVAEVDARLGRVLQRMRDTGLLDRTIVVITADHGEELFEHGWVGHASTGYDGKLYDELIRVPLLVRVPNGSFVGRSDALVQQVDIMPTLFDLLGIRDKDMKPAMQGHSLVPLVRGGRSEVRDFVFAETTLKGWTTPEEELGIRVVAVRSATQKLMWFPPKRGARIEGFDLREDPRESKNIFPQRAPDFEPLEQAREAWETDNRRAAAELVLGACERRLENIAHSVLTDDDLVAAVDEWLAIQAMGETWGREPDPFYLHEPYATKWRDTERLAAEMLAKAMDCRAKDGELRAGSADPATVRTWSCVRPKMLTRP